MSINVYEAVRESITFVLGYVYLSWNWCMHKSASVARAGFGRILAWIMCCSCVASSHRRSRVTNIGNVFECTDPLAPFWGVGVDERQYPMREEGALRW